MSPLTNAIKVLGTCTGKSINMALFLKLVVATTVVKLQINHAFGLNYFALKLKTSVCILNLSTFVSPKHLKKRSVLKEL